MVIFSRTNIFPVPDKAAEVGSIVEDFVRSNPHNIRLGLLRDAIGEIPALQVIAIYDTLEDFEKDRDANLANDDFRQAQTKASSMVRQPFVIRLASSIVDPVGQLGPQHRYTRQVIFQPTIDAQDDVRGVVEELAKNRQANGRPLSRATQSLLSHSGPAFSVLDSYETLGELENVTRQRSAAGSDLRSKLNGNLRAPFTYRLREVIVPVGN